MVWREGLWEIKGGFCSQSHEPNAHSPQFSFRWDLVNKCWFLSYNLCSELGSEDLAVNTIIMIPDLLKVNLKNNIDNEQMMHKVTIIGCDMLNGKYRLMENITVINNKRIRKSISKEAVVPEGQWGIAQVKRGKSMVPTRGNTMDKDPERRKVWCAENPEKGPSD